jgi:hypothetical protein
MNQQTHELCVHCGKHMDKWVSPEGVTWSSPYQYVCFNDECPYFVRGWAWMAEQYGVTASYRYRLDPVSHESGPLPVWSARDFRSSIIFDPEELHGHGM